MSFWSRGRRSKEPEPEPPPPAPPEIPRLSVVEFWTADQRLAVGMDLSEGRLTDLINREEALRVVMLDVPPEDPTQPLEMQPGHQWVDFAVDETLLVFPPPQPTDPHRRLHRPKQPVKIVIGPFAIIGSVHIPPGAQAAGFLFRQSSRFSPITRAGVQDMRLPGFEQRAEVVLVNLRRVEIIRDVGLDEPETFEEPSERDDPFGAARSGPFEAFDPGAQDG